LAGPAYNGIKLYSQDLFVNQCFLFELTCPINLYTWNIKYDDSKIEFISRETKQYRDKKIGTLHDIEEITIKAIDVGRSVLDLNYQNVLSNDKKDKLSFVFEIKF